jgi:hypothetical protein
MVAFIQLSVNVPPRAYSHFRMIQWTDMEHIKSQKYLTCKGFCAVLPPLQKIAFVCVEKLGLVNRRASHLARQRYRVWRNRLTEK